MSHTHGTSTTAVPPDVRRIVIYTLTPLILLTVAGMIALWPSGDGPALERGAFTEGTVITNGECPPVEGIPPGCFTATITVDEGPDAGSTVTINITEGPATPDMSPGTRVYLLEVPDAPPGYEYSLVDVNRSRPLMLLAAITAAAVVLLAGWKGVSAIVGLLSSLAILALFVLPTLVEGSDPVTVAAVGAAAIAIVSMGFAHGVRVLTGVALIGTLIALTLTTLIGWLFTQLLDFTGLATEDAAYLGAVAEQIDMRGLLLAGLVIGALGVLDDVTITQASAVWEVYGADRTLGFRRLLASGMRVGRDHVAAVVNTLVLAYVGASLPLFLLLTMSDTPILQSLSNEAIAAEILRSLVGSLGIIAAVPITTALAAVALVAARSRDQATTGSAPVATSGSEGKHEETN